MTKADDAIEDTRKEIKPAELQEKIADLYGVNQDDVFLTQDHNSHGYFGIGFKEGAVEAADSRTNMVDTELEELRKSYKVDL